MTRDLRYGNNTSAGATHAEWTSATTQMSAGSGSSLHTPNIPPPHLTTNKEGMERRTETGWSGTALEARFVITEASEGVGER
jgi:hypothetical protein